MIMLSVQIDVRGVVTDIKTLIIMLILEDMQNIYQRGIQIIIAFILN